MSALRLLCRGTGGPGLQPAEGGEHCRGVTWPRSVLPAAGVSSPAPPGRAQGPHPAAGPDGRCRPRVLRPVLGGAGRGSRVSMRLVSVWADLHTQGAPRPGGADPVEVSAAPAG